MPLGCMSLLFQVSRISKKNGSLGMEQLVALFDFLIACINVYHDHLLLLRRLL